MSSLFWRNFDLVGCESVQDVGHAQIDTIQKVSDDRLIPIIAEHQAFEQLCSFLETGDRERSGWIAVQDGAKVKFPEMLRATGTLKSVIIYRIEKGVFHLPPPSVLSFTTPLPSSELRLHGDHFRRATSTSCSGDNPSPHPPSDRRRDSDAAPYSKLDSSSPPSRHPPAKPYSPSSFSAMAAASKGGCNLYLGRLLRLQVLLLRQTLCSLPPSPISSPSASYLSSSSPPSLATAAAATSTSPEHQARLPSSAFSTPTPTSAHSVPTTITVHAPVAVPPPPGTTMATEMSWPKSYKPEDPQSLSPFQATAHSSTQQAIAQVGLALLPASVQYPPPTSQLLRQAQPPDLGLLPNRTATDRLPPL